MVNDHLGHLPSLRRARKAVKRSDDRAAKACTKAKIRDRAPGSACSRDAGSICSIPPRSTSRSRTSRMGWRGLPAGTGKPRARTSSPVAQHALLVEALARAKRSAARPYRAGLLCLLHDAPEYVIGDMISPFKAVIGDSYKAVEKRLLAAISFTLRPAGEIARAPADLIRAADRGAAYLEATRLAGFARGRRRGSSSDHRRNSPRHSSATTSVHGPAGTAQARFLERFEKLRAAEAFHAGTRSHKYVVANRDCCTHDSRLLTLTPARHRR